MKCKSGVGGGFILKQNNTLAMSWAGSGSVCITHLLRLDLIKMIRRKVEK